MMNTEFMKPLCDAISKRVNASGTNDPVQLWLRDDDAIEPTTQLNRLLDLVDRFAIPLTLAVIPAHADDALAARLATSKQVTVAVHGWSHQNHASEKEKKQELGLHRSVSDVVAELEIGFNALRRRHGEQFVPLLVPPWNRIDDAIIQALPSIGFQALSTYGTQSADAIAVMNTHVDVIDWKGTRGGRSVSDLVSEMVTLIESTHQPIGILTHHLVHDENVWQFLEQLFAATSTLQGVSWEPIVKIVPALSPMP